MFDPSVFKKNLTTQWLGQSFLYFEDLPSTNNHAKSVSSEQTVHGTVILTDSQTAGRGQRKRKWETEGGKNLTFSIIFQPKNAERLTLLTLICAYAVREAIAENSQILSKLKWPNDVLCGGKKICGILTETQFSGNHLDKVIVGIGLNVNQLDFDNELKEIATSLSVIKKKAISRELLLAAILKKIEQCYHLWNRHDNEILKRINEAMIGCGEWVKLTVNDVESDEEYKFLGVNDTGAFMALNRAMEVKTFTFEQVRVLLR